MRLGARVRAQQPPPIAYPRCSIAQTRDQEWDKGNAALREACERGVPVRVCRAVPRDGDNKKVDYT